MRKKEWEISRFFGCVNCLVISAIFAALLLWLEREKKLLTSICNLDGVIYFLILLFIWFLFFYLHKKAISFWNRWERTHKLDNPPDILFDNIAFCLFLTFCWLIYFYWISGTMTIVSGKCRLFFIITGISTLLYISITYLKSRRSNVPVCVKDASEISDYFLHDSPIMCKEQDLLGRDVFVDRLYQEITGIPYKDSIVYGLYGGWGEGKTSILNLLQSKFVDNEDFLVVYFDPWKYDNREAMLTAFYKKVEQIINEKYILEAFQSLLFKYQDIIKSGISKAGLNINFFREEPTLEDIKKRIEEFLERINKKLLFVIDDIDRMHTDEVLIMLKFVHVNLNFRNTLFILSLDYHKIRKMLKDSQKIDEDYFEKIIQKQICIPDVDQEKFEYFLAKNLDSIFDEIGVLERATVELRDSFGVIYHSQVYKLLSNMRSIKRYLNSISLSLPMIKLEVNFSDFLLLEILKVFFPKIFDDIRYNRWYYTIISWSSVNGIPFRDPFFFFKEKKNEIIKKHVDILLEDDENSEIVIEILKGLFPFTIGNAYNNSNADHDSSKNSIRLHKRIQHPDCFIKYFMLTIPKSEISDEFVESFVSKLNSLEVEESYVQTEKLLNMARKKNELLILLKKFKLFKKIITKQTARNIIEFLSKNSDKLTNNEDKQFIIDNELTYSVYLILLMMNTMYESSEIGDSIEKIINSTPSILFMVHLVSSCRSERGGGAYKVYDNININELKKIASQRLKKYFIDEKRDIFKEYDETAFLLYQWITNWESEECDDYKIVNDYLVSLVENDIKNFEIFINNLNAKSKFDSIFKAYDNIYDLNRFRKIAERYLADGNLSKEYEEALKGFVRLFEVKKKKDES